MAARPGICFEVREVCLAVIIADFLRRGTRARQDELNAGRSKLMRMQMTATTR